MSGFREDVISILRDNVMLHGEAMGLVMYGSSYEESRELLKDLESRRLPVADRADKHVFLFDYVIIPKEVASMKNLLKALSLVGNLSIIVIDITGLDTFYHKRYASVFGNFTAHQLKYQDRTYLVFKQGVDYGN